MAATSCARRAAAALAVIALFGACGGIRAQEPTAAGTGRDEGRWLLPLNEYHGAPLQMVDHATSLLLRPCLDGRGFDVPPVAAPEAAPAAAGDVAVENDVGRRLFGTEVARRHGYHFDPPGSTPPLTPTEAAALDTVEGQAAVDECMAQVERQLPAQPSADLLTALEFASYESAVHSSVVLEASSRWRECMAPAGVPDLPASPEQMPSPALVERFGLGDGAPRGEPSDDEVETAVTDATCRRTSGFETALYEEEWANQADALADNREAFDRLGAATDEHAAALARIVDEGP